MVRLTASEFLDLVHTYALRLTREEDRERLTAELTGPPRVVRPSLVDERAGFVPPSWWRGDEYASRSGVAAMMTMRG